ncbi:MAG: DUF456 domain-containing protein [Ignavibacteriaceae bacterium]|nr:DUF456 domain-containing protein [Ignavibacteriaceae bacterium]
MIEIILIILGVLIAIVGLIGCIIPAIPGPPLNFISLLILELAIEDAFSMEFYIIWGVITIVVTVLDYVLPLLGAKAYRASGYGIWCSIIGMIIGTIFFPPFGMILGLLVGAIVGELLAGKEGSEALKVGSVTFITSLLMIVVKLAVSGVMTYYFIARAAEYIF